MRHVLRTCAAIAAAMAVVAVAGLTPAQETKARPAPPKGAKNKERVGGVIVKVEEVPKEGSQKRGKRLTINTAAVWRDWVRDQATVKQPGSTKEAAKEGANSIATKGQPESPDTLFTVDVLPNTRIETRYRSSTDETSEGARTPAGAARKESDPAADRSERKAPDDKNLGTERGPRFDYASLQPGLWVDVNFRDIKEQNRAQRVVVLRPVGGPETPAREAEPKSEK